MVPKATEDIRWKSYVEPWETHRYIYMKLFFEGNYYAVAFDKSSGENRLVNKMSKAEYKNNRKQFFGFINDIDGGFALPPANIFASYDKDMWWGSFDAYKMMELLTPEHFAKVRSTVKYPDRLDKLQKFVASLTEDDNPVFVIAHLK
jgi:hypothetical protein